MNHFDLSDDNNPKPVPSLKHRAVRDLAWALFHPRLFNALPDLATDCLTPHWLDSKVVAWLVALDQSPEQLLIHLQDQRATRLGIYFEQLLSFYFSNYPRFTLLSKNLQVNNTQRTIGEYDFIVLDEANQQHYHIEVAVKFYLGYLNSDTPIKNNQEIYNWHQWLGPNKKDSLGIKMQHLIHHQMALSGTDEGKEALSAIGVNTDTLKTKLFIAGRLYYPFHESFLNTQSLVDNAGLLKSSIVPPQYSHYSNKSIEFWILKHQLIANHTKILNDNDYYVVLPRQQWMSELTHEDIVDFSLEVISGRKIKHYIEKAVDSKNDHLHIAQLTEHSISGHDKSLSSHNQLQEIRRFFVINQ